MTCPGADCIGCVECFVPRHDHPAVDGHNCIGPDCTCRRQKESRTPDRFHRPLCDGCRHLRGVVKDLRRELTRQEAAPAAEEDR